MVNRGKLFALFSVSIITHISPQGGLKDPLPLSCLVASCTPSTFLLYSGKAKTDMVVE